MVNDMKTYVCPQCDDEKGFRGLCRDCTEYDSEGNVVNPVRREQKGKHIHDENCGHYHHHAPTVDDFRNRRRPKLSKRQYQKMQDILSEANFTEGTVDEARKILQEKLSEEE
jgi:predicted ATP-dependent serine protease